MQLPKKNEEETSGRLPDAIGLGCRRCGTSWLHEALNSHPEVGKTTDGGTHFFTSEFHRGIDWYQRTLAPYSNRKALVDLSVSYLYPENYINVAQRISNHVPDAKLFIAVRNPVERAFSDYLRSVRLLELPHDLPFEEAIIHRPEYLKRGLYSKMLKPFRNAFPAEDLCVLFYDDLETDPNGYIAELLIFLDIKKNDSLHLSRKDRQGSGIRSKIFQNTLRNTKNSIDEIFKKIGLDREWGRFKHKNYKSYQSVLQINEKTIKMHKDTHTRLIEYFAEDIMQLEKDTGRSLNGWLNPQY